MVVVYKEKRGLHIMTNHASVTLSSIEKIARASLKTATNTLSDQYIRIESAAHDNTTNRNKFPNAKHEKKPNKGNKNKAEREKARRDKYENVVEDF
jgi:hypothetical protein|tara:strand:+ start:8539 stop:8826 length:288 start_codon:yes stop_codon:yes gene_type:complete